MKKGSKVFFKIKTFPENDFLRGVNLNRHPPIQTLFFYKMVYILTKR